MARSTLVLLVSLSAGCGSPSSNAQVPKAGVGSPSVEGDADSPLTGPLLDPASLPPLDDPFVEVSLGIVGCARRQSGQVWCWSDDDPVLRRVPGIHDATAIAAEGFYGMACAVRAGGRLRCWGGPAQPELDDVVWFGFDDDVGCAVRDGGVTDCWKIGDPDTRWQPFPRGARALAFGERHRCALMDTGGVHCWGDNRSGQLGPHAKVGTMVAADMPMDGPPEGAPAPVAEATAIAAGSEHTCAARRDGRAVCWGTDYQGVLGAGDARVSVGEPVVVTGLRGVLEVDANKWGWSTCARTRGGEVWCWGSNTDGELGDVAVGSVRQAPVQVPSITGATDIDVTIDRACATTGGGYVVCWGDHGSSLPRKVPGLSRVVELAGAAGGTCARRADGEVLCWGDFQYIDGDTFYRWLRPTPAPHAQGLRGIDAETDLYEWAVCGLGSDRVVCSLHTPTGGGDIRDLARLPRLRVEVDIADPRHVDSASGAQPDCALRGDGGVSCWAGANGAPFAIDGAKDARDLALCSDAACWVMAGGAVACAMVGFDSEVDEWRASPTRVVPDLDDARDLACDGQGDPCVLHGSGAVTCFDPSSDTEHEHVLTGIATLGEGCGITEGGALVCWHGPVVDAGGFDFVHLSRSRPLTVPGVDDAVDVVQGGEHACILHADQTVSCWGANDKGQLGDGRGGGAVWAVSLP